MQSLGKPLNKFSIWDRWFELFLLSWDFFQSHIENLFKGLPSDCIIITLIDGHPLTLSWLSGVNGNPLKSLGVDEFGQTGNSFELYEHFGIDSRTLVETAIK